METKKVSSIEADQYIGTDVEVIEAVFKQMKGPVIMLRSNVIELKGDDKLPDDKVLTATKILGLRQDGENVVIGEGSATSEFLKGKKIDTSKIPEFKEDEQIDCLIGMKCKVQKSKTGYLDLA